MNVQHPPDPFDTPRVTHAAGASTWTAPAHDHGQAATAAPAHGSPYGAATAAAAAPVSRRRGQGTVRRVVSWCVGCAVLVAVGIAMLSAQSGGGIGSTAGSSLGSSKGSGGGSLLGGSGGDEAYGYYHDAYFDSGAYAPQWRRDGLLQRRDEWAYDGPYAYGGYGSAGMRARSKGKNRRDPLYSVNSDLPDVFDQYGATADPTGGDPVGDPALWNIDPGYNPYLGYSNPYANRIRLAYGPGYGRGAYVGRR